MASLGITPSQTVGPFFGPALLRDEQRILTGPQTAGERIRIEGRVTDGDGAAAPDALVEIWQANSYGRYNHPLDQREAVLDAAFTGYGRAGTDDDGRFWFETVRPGAVPFDDTRWQSPHMLVTVLARGLLRHAVTRLYFADDPTLNGDPVLQLVPSERRSTLLARPVAGAASTTYRFDIVLHGDGETVFFAF